MKKNIIIFITLFLNSLFVINAQNVIDIIEENNSLKYYNIGKDLYQNKKYFESIPYFKNILQSDKYRNDTEVKYLLANAYRNERFYKEAEKLYKIIYDRAGDKYPLALLWHGNVKQSQNKFKEAFGLYEQFIEQHNTISKDTIALAKQYKESCQLGMESIKNPNKKYHVAILDNDINTEYSSYSPYMQDNTLYYTGTITKSKRSNIELPSAKGKYREVYLDRIFYAPFNTSDNSWEKSEESEINPPDNELSHIFSPCFSVDGKTIYFTVSQTDDDNINAIYKCNYSNGKITSEPEKISFSGIHSDKSVKTPMIAQINNENIIFFASDESSDNGTFDIYYGIIHNNGRVTKTKKLNNKINTEKDEMAPFYDAKNNVLYFSSNGHKGLGNFDIFKTEGNPSDGWKKVENLSVPVNSGADDYYYFHIAINDSAYGFFSSNRFSNDHRSESYIYDKIYRFERERSNIIIKGEVFEASTKAPIPEAKLKIINSQTNEIVKEVKTDQEGNYKVEISFEEKFTYNVEITASGYMFYNKTIRFINGKYIPMETLNVLSGDEESSNVNTINFPLEKLEERAKITLENVYFEYNKATLSPESYKKLDRVIEFLKQNPEIKKVEISGHTDNIGSFSYNVKLSRNRARSVVEYLVNNGISSERLVSQGYAFEYPIAPNSSPEGREKNRRVEFEIIRLE
jgi:outer membrane protein OmpA-like peptidoglycan-associated protein